MKSLVRKIGRILRSHNGESLMEGIASVLVLTVLIAAVTTIILVSLKITESSIARAEKMQDDVNNPAILANYSAAGETTITFYDAAPESGISATHGVLINEAADGLIAFTPLLP